MPRLAWAALLLALVLAPDAAAATAVPGGSLSGDVQWTAAGSPYTLSGTVVIPPTASLTIAPGVEVRTADGWSGALFHLGGELTAQGTQLEPVVISGGGHDLVNAAFSSAASHAAFEHADIENVGSLWPPTGYEAYGSLALTDSTVTDVAHYAYIWYPRQDVEIARNVFRDAAGFSVGTSEATVTFDRNVFVGAARESGCDGAWICNWAAYNGTTTQVHGNNFARTSGIVLSLPSGYTGAAIDASGNYWGSMSEADVAARVLDSNDSFGRPGEIETEPLLDVPDALAPAAPPPEPPVVSGAPPELTNVPSASIEFAGEIGATFSCSLDGADYAACSSPLELASLDDGEHTLAVRQADELAAVSEPTTVSWVIDTTAPDTEIVSAPSTSGPDATFTFGAEPDSTFECSLDDGPWEVCASPHDYTGLALGDHTFAVRARDVVGNVEATPATAQFTVADMTAPETELLSGPATSGPDPIFTFSAEPDSTFECSLDDGAWESCDSPHGYSGLVSGPHTFAVRARDAAGNVDPTPVTTQFTVVVADSDGGGAATGGTPSEPSEPSAPVPPAPDAGAEPPGATPPPPPSGPVGVSVNGGARYTRDPQVVVSVVWPAGAESLLISNDGGFATAQTFPVAASIPWSLDSAGPERLPKTIYVRFGTSTQTFQDDIILDETAPTVAAATVTDTSDAARAAAAGGFRVEVRARDRTSGVREMQFAATKSRPLRFQRFRRRATTRVLPRFVRVRDGAGNVSKWRRVVRG